MFVNCAHAFHLPRNGLWAYSTVGLPSTVVASRILPPPPRGPTDSAETCSALPKRTRHSRSAVGVSLWKCPSHNISGRDCTHQRVMLTCLVLSLPTLHVPGSTLCSRRRRECYGCRRRGSRTDHQSRGRSTCFGRPGGRPRRLRPAGSFRADNSSHCTSRSTSCKE